MTQPNLESRVQLTGPEFEFLKTAATLGYNGPYIQHVAAAHGLSEEIVTSAFE